MYPYYQPLDLVLDHHDWRFLNFLSHRYLNEAYHYEVNGYVFTGYSQFFLRDATEDYRDQKLFEKISNLFVSDSLYSDPSHVYQWSQVSTIPGSLPIHTDTRTAVISIPIVTFTAPVVWYDDQENALCSYDYDGVASLINTSITHGLPHNTTRRIFLQVGGMRESYDDCLSQLKKIG